MILEIGSYLTNSAGLKMCAGAFDHKTKENTSRIQGNTLPVNPWAHKQDQTNQKMCHAGLLRCETHLSATQPKSSGWGGVEVSFSRSASSSSHLQPPHVAPTRCPKTGCSSWPVVTAQKQSINTRGGPHYENTHIVLTSHFIVKLELKAPSRGLVLLW